MSNEHLSEEEIQELVLNKLSHAHVAACALCKEKAEAYQLLITAIEQEPAPVLDFDLEELVITKIETKKSRYGWVIAVMAIGLIISGALLYFFRVDLFTGINSFLIYLLAITGLFFMAALVIDQLNTYKNKLQQINQHAVS